MRFLYLVFAAILVGVLVWAYRSGAFTFLNADKHKQAMVIIRGERFRVDVADTMSTRDKGLGGRAPLLEDEGMLFLFPSPGDRTFWMKGVDFPIDIIWILDDKVVGFAQDAQPEPGVPLHKLRRYPSPVAVDKVLEVPAGTVKRVGIVVGDGVNIEL